MNRASQQANSPCSRRACSPRDARATASKLGGYTNGSRVRRPRGFAVLIAVMMIALVAAVLAALTVSFASDAKRSRRGAEDAQLRQLLLAGEIAARDAVGHATSGEVKLPADLAADGMSLRYETIPGNAADDVQIRVTAQIAERRAMNQVLHFAKAGDHWELRAAEF